MKNILWISRHKMTDEQYADLEKIMGEEVTLNQFSDTVRDVNELRPLIERADVIAAVLPPDMLQSLLETAGNKAVIRSVSSRVPTGRMHVLPDGGREPEFAFTHTGWERILKITVERQKLSALSLRSV